MLSAAVLLLCSCKQHTEAPPSQVPNVVTETITATQPASDTVSVSHPPPLAEDEAEMLRVITAGKQFVAELQRREQPVNARDDDNGSTADAVSVFERFFRLDTLHVSGVFIPPDVPGYYICMISGVNEFGSAASVKVYFYQGELMTWYCPIVYYGASIDRVMEIYLGYLKDNDPYGLAGWLQERLEPDDTFVKEVKRTTDYYNRHYDLSKAFIREDETRIVESGFFYSNEGFILTVEDARGNTFQVELGCGDGLCFPHLLQEWQLRGDG
jgi:hypothetical protein